ncbi:hypothetical protein DM02DRAFT_727131 [Periconia macrospinosa]|uniref:Uncharacterized protein n=1 Tax=Periconia macrospinosa TaxID=97972 RepID=A0A2V1DWQ0_9PLEO|nr:hypothetical protein DM02DRAFT_727131 [Periconia macrospinosa]
MWQNSRQSLDGADRGRISVTAKWCCVASTAEAVRIQLIGLAWRTCVLRLMHGMQRRMEGASVQSAIVLIPAAITRLCLPHSLTLRACLCTSRGICCHADPETPTCTCLYFALGNDGLPITEPTEEGKVETQGSRCSAALVLSARASHGLRRAVMMPPSAAGGELHRLYSTVQFLYMCVVVRWCMAKGEKGGLGWASAADIFINDATAARACSTTDALRVAMHWGNELISRPTGRYASQKEGKEKCGRNM